MISSETIAKSLYGNFEKRLLECEKVTSRKIFRHLFHANFFTFILLTSDPTVFFLARFEINLHLWVKKVAIALAEATSLKTYSCKLIPNWTRNRMITYTSCSPRAHVYVSFHQMFHLLFQQSHLHKSTQRRKVLQQQIKWTPLEKYTFVHVPYTLHSH